MDITEFKTTDKEVKGVCHRIGDATFTIASFNSPAYQKALAEELEPHQREIRRETFSSDKRHECMVRAMSKTILLGWSNLTEDGKPVPYSPAKAEGIFLRFPKFCAEVMSIASSTKGYEDEADAAAVEALKNG